MNFNKREEQFMNIGTAANAVFHMRQVEEKELKREKIASWYITVPGIIYPTLFFFVHKFIFSLKIRFL